VNCGDTADGAISTHALACSQHRPSWCRC
jgi:hypothetical protein